MCKWLGFNTTDSLIQQIDLLQQNITNSTHPKVVIKSSIKLFFYPLFKKDSSD